MSKADLYIIAAGRGSRMGGNLPKALVPIANGVPNITTTLEQASGKFNNIFIVVNEQILEPWGTYMDWLGMAENSALAEGVYLVPITSGLGDGHAVLGAFEAVLELEPTNGMADDAVICWGDAFIQSPETFTELLAQDISGAVVSGVVPAVKEDNPYVALITGDDMLCKSADFSKYGETNESGYHDQSVFRFRYLNVSAALYILHASMWKNGRFMTPGGELSLLHVFHFLHNMGNPVRVFETKYPTLSFNTPEEVATIQKEISAKWKQTHQS